MKKLKHLNLLRTIKPFNDDDIVVDDDLTGVPLVFWTSSRIRLLIWVSFSAMICCCECGESMLALTSFWKAPFIEAKDATEKIRNAIKTVAAIIT